MIKQLSVKFFNTKSVLLRRKDLIATLKLFKIVIDYYMKAILKRTSPSYRFIHYRLGILPRNKSNYKKSRAQVPACLERSLA